MFNGSPIQAVLILWEANMKFNMLENPSSTLHKMWEGLFQDSSKQVGKVGLFGNPIPKESLGWNYD